MRIPLLILFLVFGLQNMFAQSVFKNPTTDIVEIVLNEHHKITKKLIEQAVLNQTNVESAISTITLHAKGSTFKADFNNPNIEWEWGWIQAFEQNESDAIEKYKLIIKQLSNSIINFHESKKSAVLHIQSSNVQHSNKVYFELLPIVENISVLVELKFETVWKVELKVIQLKNKNQFVMN